jgi:hypothetical protein
MSKLKPQKFTLEGFGDQSSWIGKLFSPLNQVLNDLVISFNNGISIEDNLFQEIKEVSFKNDTNNFPLRFRTKFNQNPKGMLLIFIFDETIGSCATQVPVVVWTYQNGEIVISSMSGLTASTNYTVRFLVIYG